MEKVKILAVGIGGYANIYLDAMASGEITDFTIVGAVDVAPEGCRNLDWLRSNGVPIYSSVEEFYREHTADLAIITTPIFLHTRQTITCLEGGSNVMCEKPLSGVSSDAKLIEEAAKKAGKFVMIGYQWSYSEAITKLKADILSGFWGKPKLLKSMVLWPRPKAYYTRGTGWGGKRRAPDGTVMNDSVVNNATAHYIHNMLFVTGKRVDTSSEILRLKADLLRANDIETYDTATLRATLDCGAEVLYIASHATDRAVEPRFEYRFKGGTISYTAESGRIIGRTTKGEEIDYGDPFADINRKIKLAIEATKSGIQYTPECGVFAAYPEVRCAEMLAELPPLVLSHDVITDNNGALSVNGLTEMLERCYSEEKLLSDLPEYSSFTPRN